MEKPIVNKRVKLEKFEGKGGWTYARLPEVKPGKSWFNWVKVKGCIDDYEIKAYNLMPIGNGQLFLPVKKEIRKKIKKEAGDEVSVFTNPSKPAFLRPAAFKYRCRINKSASINCTRRFREPKHQHV